MRGSCEKYMIWLSKSSWREISVLEKTLSNMEHPLRLHLSVLTCGLSILWTWKEWGGYWEVGGALRLWLPRNIECHLPWKTVGEHTVRNQLVSRPRERSTRKISPMICYFKTNGLWVDFESYSKYTATVSGYFHRDQSNSAVANVLGQLWPHTANWRMLFVFCLQMSVWGPGRISCGVSCHHCVGPAEYLGI